MVDSTPAQGVKSEHAVRDYNSRAERGTILMAYMM